MVYDWSIDQEKLQKVGCSFEVSLVWAVKARDANVIDLSVQLSSCCCSVLMYRL